MSVCLVLHGVHYSGVIISATASLITGVFIVCSSVCSGADQITHQSSASLVFVRGTHRWPVDFPYKGPVTRKMFPFDDVIMKCFHLVTSSYIYGYCKPRIVTKPNLTPFLIPFVVTKTIGVMTTHDDAIKWKHFPRYWPFVWWISRTKASDAKLWCFLWSAHV